MASTSPIKDVAIIGAGLAGLSLALALHKHKINSTIYEVRGNDFVQGGAIMLSPNALQVLNKLGVYTRIATKGYHFETLTFKNASHDTTDVYYFGQQQLYGYKAFRVYRQVLIDELKMMLEEKGIEIRYHMRFTHVLSESQDNSVTFQLANGETSTTSLLIGADGIHSTVRHYLHPSIEAEYMGSVGITSAIPITSIRFPAEHEGPYPLPVTISAKPGAFVIAPQDIDGSECLIGRQVPFPEQDRHGWSDLKGRQDEIVKILSWDQREWPDMVQSAMENINPDKINLWPYYFVPRLDSWVSETGRVFILGDAAHAVPPTTGQGVNQAFEDVYMLALILGHSNPSSSSNSAINLKERLTFWQKFRQERVDRILDLTRRMNNKRLPLEEQSKLGEGEVWSGTKEDTQQMAWLYGVDLDKEVERL